jgi:DNA repair protein RecN (Recombination protein N)
MISSLSIKNYLLIDNLELNFAHGFSVITGETGAGKSIILGAISLLLGKRAETDVMFDKNAKCVIEASFNINNTNVKNIFDENDLDFENITIIRREVIPGGKSRAFINDTPVNLSVLKQISENLLDLHSQHENLALSISDYRLKIIDTIASTTTKFEIYSERFNKLSITERELENKKVHLEKLKKDIDYYRFQLEQIESVKLGENSELEELENQSAILENAEEIKENIQQSLNILENDEFSVEFLLRELKSLFSKLSRNYKPAEDILNRTEAIIIEIRDIATALSNGLEKAEVNPELLQKINNRIDVINNLLTKHNVDSITELKNKYLEFSNYISNTDEIEETIKKLENLIRVEHSELSELAKNLSESRSKYFAKIEEHITNLLKDLGMEHAIFKIDNEILSNISPSGIDNISFLFSANKSIKPQPLDKIASGGEFSRLMLALKSLVTNSSGISTIIFDEIDTGVSGEIASRMGKIMSKISNNIQVISITHLPQVAALGNNHFKVFKDNSGNRSITKIKNLSKDERIIEIASMISGETLTEQAKENAKILLNSNK